MFGPVADPAADRSVAVIEVDTEDQAHTLRASDPVVVADIGPVDVFPMPVAITRRS